MWCPKRARRVQIFGSGSELGIRVDLDLLLWRLRRSYRGGYWVTAAQELIAEVGVDMGRFACDAHLVSWAKFCPQVHESAGKKPKGRGKGNPWLAGTLGNMVATAARTDRGGVGRQPARGVTRNRAARPPTPMDDQSAANRRPILVDRALHNANHQPALVEGPVITLGVHQTLWQGFGADP
jgi:Transposase IS116/IS110/IS902 family